MNRKFSKYCEKAFVALVVAVFCNFSVVGAYTFSTSSVKDANIPNLGNMGSIPNFTTNIPSLNEETNIPNLGNMGSIPDFTTSIPSLNENVSIPNLGNMEGIPDFTTSLPGIDGGYDLEDLQLDLSELQQNNMVDIDQIKSLIDKLPAGDSKDILNGITDTFSDLITDAVSESGLDELINMLNDVSLAMGSSLVDVVTPVIISFSDYKNPESVYMDATTAVEFAGEKYAAKLHANVYRHLDRDGNPDSDKWVLLVHPFMFNGQLMANSVAPFYYEKGYNIIAPDLRGFGESEGSVAMGFIESLDVYDWLNKLNEDYEVDSVIVHGVSLGAATTNYLSGIDKFMEKGPKSIEPLKSLRELNVIGLVEDCGYTNMTEFGPKFMLLALDVGMDKSNFNYYSNSLNSLKHCDLPMLVIHGTADTMVKPENADKVKNTAKGDVEQWLVDGAPHAFIVTGLKQDEYKAYVQSFIKNCEESRSDVVEEKIKSEANVSTNEVSPEELSNAMNNYVNDYINSKGNITMPTSNSYMNYYSSYIK